MASRKTPRISLRPGAARGKKAAAGRRGLAGNETMQLSVREVARLLKISENTVYRWVDERSLPAQQINSQYFFNKAELLEWAALHKVDVSRAEIFADAPRPEMAPRPPWRRACRRRRHSLRRRGDRPRFGFAGRGRAPKAPRRFRSRVAAGIAAGPRIARNDGDRRWNCHPPPADSDRRAARCPFDFAVLFEAGHPLRRPPTGKAGKCHAPVPPPGPQCQDAFAASGTAGLYASRRTVSPGRDRAGKARGDLVGGSGIRCRSEDFDRCPSGPKGWRASRAARNQETREMGLLLASVGVAFIASGTLA